MKISQSHRLVIEDGEDFNFRFDGSPHQNPNMQLSQRMLIIHAPTSASVPGAVSQLLARPPKNSFLLRSTHLVLGRDGKAIVQMIPFSAGANHASGFNNRSISLDLQYPGELVEKGAAFQMRRNFAENEYILASGLGSARFGFWPLYPKAQLDALVIIARALMETYNIVDIVAHDEILSTVQPGPAFPIVHFREKLLGVTDRSILFQETARAVSLLGQPEMESTLLSESTVPKGTPVLVINERFDWYLVAVIEPEGNNPWQIGWVEKNAVRVKTDIQPAVRPDHYLATAEGRRFQEITPHGNGFHPTKTNAEPKFIIMHFTTGTRMESTINHFKSPSSGVSTHLLIGRDGRVVQFLPFDRLANHCGYSWWERQSNLNNFSIGIELDNAGLLRRNRGKWVRHKIVIPDEEVEQAVHWKQFTPSDPARFPGWQKFTKVQLDVALAIVKALVARYPSITEILGHDDINLKNRYDPGPLFPMEKFRQQLFGRKQPLIEEYFLNHATDIYGNFRGRLPNTQQREFDSPLPANSLVRVIREEDEFTLVSVIKAKDSKIRGTGWVQTASLEALGGKKGGRQMKARGKGKSRVEDRRRTTISQPFFKRGASAPTPKLWQGPFKAGERLRVQEFRGEWTLVVLLDPVRGRGGLEGWVPTEFVSPKVEQ